ncbi:MAG: cytochrome c maturation protein CcmE [Armatimonadota bacterium]|nr:cytochrome c maturation protein CcmE [bacterium]
MNRKLYILGALLIAGFGYLGINEMMAARAPYVTSVAEVCSINGSAVQFIGRIEHSETDFSERANELLFTMRDDKGETLKVRYKGVKPANFDSAEKAVVRGKYADGELRADHVLVKCPSRYRGK